MYCMSVHPEEASLNITPYFFTMIFIFTFDTMEAKTNISPYKENLI